MPIKKTKSKIVRDMMILLNCHLMKLMIYHSLYFQLIKAWGSFLKKAPHTPAKTLNHSPLGRGKPAYSCFPLLNSVLDRNGVKGCPTAYRYACPLTPAVN